MYVTDTFRRCRVQLRERGFDLCSSGIRIGTILYRRGNVYIRIYLHILCAYILYMQVFGQRKRANTSAVHVYELLKYNL